MSGDNLTWLSEWYLAQCDSDWEHTFGVKIDTLDNPGWSLKIELTDTDLQKRTFERVAHGKPTDDLEEWQRTGGWWIASVSGRVFEAHCGPLDLSTVIGIFREWAERTA